MNRAIALLTLTLTVGGAACSGDTAGESNDNNGWQLGDDAGQNAGADAGANNTTAPPPNNTTAPPPNNTTAPPPNNTTAPPPNNTTGGNGMGVEGDDCSLNSDCGADLVCCPGFSGDATCQPQCFGGGLCGGNMGECAAGEVCCDLSGINQPDACTSENLCPGSGPNPGQPCQNNTECTDPEVCCLGFDGNGECTTDCLSGGACDTAADCRNGQDCCDLTVAKVCFDQCSF